MQTKNLFSSTLSKVVLYVVFVIAVLFMILVVVRIFHFSNVDATNVVVDKIHSTKLTMDDVLGANLPPDPGLDADKTVQGIDANNNGIRDDVELAIFKSYPDSAKTRAVLLQYALALQMEFTQPIVNKETVTEVVREQSRGFVCIGNIVSRENSQKFDDETSFLTAFVKDKELNTIERKNQRNSFLEKLGSYSQLNEDCDIDLDQLKN